MLALRLTYKTLWMQVLLALAYSLPLCVVGALTPSAVLDGFVGGALGLYICSHPARNVVDLLFAGRFAFQRVRSGWAGCGWLALNVLVLLAGWLVLFLGIVRLMAA